MSNKLKGPAKWSKGNPKVMSAKKSKLQKDEAKKAKDLAEGLKQAEMLRASPAMRVLMPAGILKAARKAEVLAAKQKSWQAKQTPAGIYNVDGNLNQEVQERRLIAKQAAAEEGGAAQDAPRWARSIVLCGS